MVTSSHHPTELSAFSGAIEGRVRPIMASLRTAPLPLHEGYPAPPVLPFVTISRQAGAGGISLARSSDRFSGLQHDGQKTAPSSTSVPQIPQKRVAIWSATGEPRQRADQHDERRQEENDPARR